MAKIVTHNHAMKNSSVITNPPLSTIIPSNMATIAKPKFWAACKLKGNENLKFLYHKLVQTQFTYTPNAVPNWCFGQINATSSERPVKSIALANPIAKIAENGSMSQNASIKWPPIVTTVERKIQVTLWPVLSRNQPKNGLVMAESRGPIDIRRSASSGE